MTVVDLRRNARAHPLIDLGHTANEITKIIRRRPKQNDGLARNVPYHLLVDHCRHTTVVDPEIVHVLRIDVIDQEVVHVLRIDIIDHEVVHVHRIDVIHRSRAHDAHRTNDIGNRKVVPYRLMSQVLEIPDIRSRKNIHHLNHVHHVTSVRKAREIDQNHGWPSVWTKINQQLISTNRVRRNRSRQRMISIHGPIYLMFQVMQPHCRRTK